MEDSVESMRNHKRNLNRQRIAETAATETRTNTFLILLVVTRKNPTRMMGMKTLKEVVRLISTTMMIAAAVARRKQQKKCSVKGPRDEDSYGCVTTLCNAW